MHRQGLTVVLAHPSRVASERIDRRMRRVMGQKQVGAIHVRQDPLGRVADGQTPRFRKLSPKSLDSIANNFPLFAIRYAGLPFEFGFPERNPPRRVVASHLAHNL